MAVTPNDWLNRLYPQLTSRAPGLRTLDAYYRGDHPLPFVTKAHQDKVRSEFRQMLDDSRSNFMKLVIDAADERIQVEGFRLSAESDLQADKDSWDIWQANDLDSLSRAAFLESLIKGVSYFSVWEDQDDDGFADIAVEDPLETIVAYTPGSNFRKRDAALKAWSDVNSGLERANVYLPDGIYKFQRPLQSNMGGTAQGQEAAGDSRKWEPLDDGTPAFVENRVGIVPIIPVRNNPRVLIEGCSDIEDVVHIQNQVNSFLFMLALAGYFGAHRQRWAVGIKMMVDEESGQVKEPFDVAIDRLWASEDPAVKFGDFQATDLGNYLKAIDQKVEHIALITRTPRHYMIPSGQEPSGDAIKSAESGLVKRVTRKQETFADGLEDMIRLARKFQGAKDMPVDSEVVWADPAVESEAVRADATIKKYAAGLIPKVQALEDLGYSQVQISRIMAEDLAEKLISAAAVPPPAPAAAGAPPEVIAEPGDLELPSQPTAVKPMTIRA